MTVEPVTRPSLIARLQDFRDEEAWDVFVRLYAPMVYGFARKQGLQEADAADLSQDVLRAVAGAAGRLSYDPRRGTFRAWLFTVTRNRWRDFVRNRLHHCQGSGDSGVQAELEQEPATTTTDWEEEFQRQIFATACERVQGDFESFSWQAFWHVCVDGQKAGVVAKHLGLTVGEVYIAKSRILARLREEVAALVDE